MANQNLPSTSQGLCPSLHPNSYFFSSLCITRIFIFILITHIPILTFVVLVVCLYRMCFVSSVNRSALLVATMLSVLYAAMYHMHI